MKTEKLYLVQEYHRKEWIDISVKTEDGERKSKTVKITEAQANELNRDSKSTAIRYVEVVDKSEFDSMNVPSLKKWAKDNGIEIGDASTKVEILGIIAKAQEVIEG